MNLKAFTFLFFAFFSLISFGQNANKNIINSWSWQGALAVMPAFVDDNGNIDQFLFYDYGLNYRLRYNITEKDDNNSISFVVNPGVGAYLGFFQEQGSDLFALGGANLALGINYNTGAGATYDADKNNGWAFSGGVDFLYVPLLVASDGSDLDPKQFYIAPYIEIGYRYWGKKSNALREFFLRVNIMGHEDGTESLDPVTPFLIRGGVAKFINY